MIRRIIHIDQDKCNGCGACAKACHEGAIDMVDGKARLMREHYCDGLGDCLPACPTGAITFEEREAPAYDEAAVKAAQAAKKQAHTGCPGTAIRQLMHKKPAPPAPGGETESQLTNWPVQIKLVPTRAPYFDGAELLIAADCTAYARADFHQRFMRGRITLIDGDDVALSNTNRQLPAFEGAYGRAKAEVLRERCLLINPDCRIEVKTVFVTPENAAQVIPSDCDWLVDCIDDLKGKAALHAAARGMGVRTVCAGGAGARIDPSRIEVSDLARVKGDPLLGKLRTCLRKEYGFPAGSADGRSTLFGIPAVYSTEPLRQPGADSLEAIGAEPGSRIGFGSFVSVTGSAGLRLAGIATNDIAVAQNTAD